MTASTPVRPEPGASRRLRLEPQTNERPPFAVGSETGCHDAVCITCSDSAVPVRVVELLEAGMARVEAGGVIGEINAELVDAEVGAVLLVHAGVAIGRVQ